MSNPRDDERRKFEVWAKALWDADVEKDEEGTYKMIALEHAWDGWLARAEQAETPRVAEPVKQIVNRIIAHLALKHGEYVGQYWEELVAVGEGAAAPVEDRPAPTWEDEETRG